MSGSQAEHHTGNPAITDIAADFMYALSQILAQRHANRPAIFHVTDILSNRTSVLSGQGFDPLPDRHAPLAVV